MMLIFKVFVTLPLQFNDNSCEKKNPTRGTELHPGVSVQVYFHTPSCLCLLCITAKLAPRRWTENGPLNLSQRFDRSLRFLLHVEAENEHEGNDLNSARELANLKAEDSISLHSMLLHC